MERVQSHLTKFMVAQVEENDPVRQLQHLHAVLEKDVRDPRGPTLVARRRIGLPSERDFAVLPQDLGGVWLENWTGVIADKLVGVADAVSRAARPVDDRPGPRRRRFEARKIRVSPNAGEIRDGCSD